MIERFFKFDKKILKGITWIGIGNILSQALAFFFMIILARYYSKSDYGYINYVISIGTLAATIVAAGFPSALIRFIAKYLGKQKKLDAYFTNILIINLGLLFAVILGVAIIYRLNIAIISIVLGYSVVYIYLGVIRGFIDYKKIALFNVFRNLIKITILIILCYFLYIRSSFFIILLYAFGGWIVLLILEILKPTQIHFFPNLLSRKVIKEVTKFSIPVMITMFAYTVLANIPVIAIEFYYDFELVGTFSAARTLTIVFSFVPIAIITITYPKIANVENKERRIKYTVQSLKFILISGIIMFTLIIFFGELGLIIVFTEKYASSYPILLILSIGGIFGGLHSAFGSLWGGSGHPIIETYAIITASIVCIILSFILIPFIGPIGVAYASSLGFIGAFIIDLRYWIIYRYTGKLNLEE